MIGRFIERNDKELSLGIKLTKLLYAAERITIKAIATLVSLAKTKPKRMIAKKIIHRFMGLYLQISNLKEVRERLALLQNKFFKEP